MEKVMELFSYKSEVDTNVFGEFDMIIVSTNENYFQKPTDIFNSYSIVFDNYMDYIYKTNEFDFVNFLHNSVNSENGINDKLETKEFSIVDNKINVSLFNNDYKFDVYSCFQIYDYLIYSYSNRFFIINTETNEKYHYLGD